MNLKTIDTGEYCFNEITFFLNGHKQIARLAPGLSTLNFLNKQLHLYGTKCSCNEGDCGACTVVISYPKDGEVLYEAINSCIYPAAKLHGKHLITVEGLGKPEELHPIQQALLEHHGTQCGYCTPGFVMSLFAMLATITHPNQENIMAALEGNLCRCTGYQSILEAAEELSQQYDPNSIVPSWCRAIEAELFCFTEEPKFYKQHSDSQYQVVNYQIPRSSDELLQMLNDNPNAVIIAGGTDIMVQANISGRHFETLIDITAIKELKNINLKADGLHFGACVTYSNVMDSGIVKSDLPELVNLCRLIASKQIRNFGTIVGNIANASPIGDSLPLLLVYQARLKLCSLNSEREIALNDFFISYRKTALQPGEYIKELIIPIPPRDSFIRAIKTAKRKSVDISSVASAIRIDTQAQSPKLMAWGGVAATPIISKEFNRLCTNPDRIDWQALANAIAAEFEPLSDVRGSAKYRKQMIINHVLQYREAYHG